jgi:hypothetical protein
VRRREPILRRRPEAGQHELACEPRGRGHSAILSLGLRCRPA